MEPDAGPDAAVDVAPRPHGPVHAVDLLFMIDDSGAMASLQFLLRAQLPRLVEALTRGDRDHDGTADFPQVTSLHVGVVSSDLGMPGIDVIDGCPGLGDDGVLNDTPDPHFSSPADVDGCAPRYPRFLSFDASSSDALSFTPDAQGQGTRGQGNGGGANEGFLRDASDDDAVLLAIVMLSNEDDCSRPDSSFLRPPQLLDPSVPGDAELGTHGLGVRCTLKAGLHPIERYIDGFRALRKGREDLVLFSVIAGVPSETVARVPADFGESRAARDAFYAGILEHPAMQQRIDTLGTPSVDDDTIVPSCDTALGRAYPPRRLVEVARAFGAGGMVQSACQEDYAPAVDAIVARIAERLEATPDQDP